MVGQQIPIDQTTICGYVASNALLEQGAPRMRLATFLAEIVSAVPVPQNGPYYLKLVIEAAARRRVAAAGGRLVEVAGTGSLADLKEIIGMEFAAVQAAIAKTEQVVG